MPVVDTTDDSARPEPQPGAEEAAGSSNLAGGKDDQLQPVSKLRKILSDPNKAEDCDAVIAKLKAEQAELSKNRDTLKKQLRKEQKKRSKLRAKARELSNEDLLAVLLMRNKTAEAAASAESSRPGSSTDA